MQISKHPNDERSPQPGRHRLRRSYAQLVLLLGLALAAVAFPGRLAQATPAHQGDSQIVETELGSPYTLDDRPPPAPQAVQGTLQNFKTIADADVREGAPAQNFGLEPTMSAGFDDYGAGPNGLKQRALLRFGVSRFLPPGTVIHSARLRLPLFGSCDAIGATSPFWIDQIDADWVEMSVNWNNQPQVAQTYGPFGIGTMPPNASAPVWYNFDIAELVRAWVGGERPEYGLLIRGLEPPSLDCGYRTFLTKGGGGFNTAPLVEVDFTLPATALSLSQQNITFTQPCAPSARPPAPQVISIQSNSDTLITWSATATGGTGQLTLGKTSGKASRIFADELTIDLNPTAPCPAPQNTQLQVNIDGPGPTKAINVTLKPLDRVVYLPMLSTTTGPATSTIASAGPTIYQRLALVIGVADYQHLPNPPTFSPFRPGKWGFRLLATRGDAGAVAMERDFSDTGDIGPPSLTQSPAATERPNKTFALIDQQATLANITHALRWIDDHEDADTEVFVYFSGHGGPTTDEAPLDEDESPPLDEMLGAYDTDTTNNGFVDHLLDDNLKSLLANLETQHLAVIFDACNSGGMEIGNAQRAVLAAAREDQVSWETSQLEHGVFTYFMLKAIRTPSCDTNADGWLSVKEIYDCANQNVADYVQSHMSAEQNLVLDLTSDVRVVRIRQ